MTARPPLPLPPLIPILILISIAIAHAALAPDPATPTPPPPGATPPAPAQRSAADLEKLVAPIALHPDPLIATLLPASVYPLEIVQAARFVANTNNLARLDEPDDPDHPDGLTVHRPSGTPSGNAFSGASNGGRLGSRTAKAASRLDTYNPDRTWMISPN